MDIYCDYPKTDRFVREKQLVQGTLAPEESSYYEEELTKNSSISIQVPYLYEGNIETFDYFE